MVLGGFGGGAQEAGMAPRGLSDPLNQDFSKKTPNTHTHGNWQTVLGLWVIGKGYWQGQVDGMTHTRRRAKRGGGYLKELIFQMKFIF